MTTLYPSDPRHCNQLISTNGFRARRVQKPVRALAFNTQIELTSMVHRSKEEICGFLTEFEHIVLVKNVHEKPRYNFYMDFDSVEEAVKDIYDIKNTKIMGIFHTHPNNQPWPSPRDLVGWPNPALKWRYFIATRHEVIEWERYVPES